MDEIEQPDPRLRDRLRGAADAELPEPLGELHKLQLVQSLLAEHQALRRRKRVWRTGLGLAAACALALVSWPRAVEHEASAPAALCALPTQVQVGRDARGRPFLDLGRFGQLVGSEDAAVSMEGAAPCALQLRLSRGTLAGALDNLRPGHLSIRTAQGEVVVRGTRFSVSVGDELRVVLLSGKVELLEDQRPALVLAPNQVLHKTRNARTILPVARQDRERIDTLLSRAVESRAVVPALPGLAVVAGEAVDAGLAPRVRAKSAAALLEQAELARKAGALAQARRLYGAASAFSDEDAEVALLRWVRLELADHDLTRATQLLDRHRQRFAAGKLRAEAAWLQIEVLRARGEPERTQRHARDLLERYPGTPQAEAARALLRGP